MYLTCFQSLQWLIANSVIIMAGKGPSLVKAWALWKIWGGHWPPCPPPQMAPLGLDNLNEELHTTLLLLSSGIVFSDFILQPGPFKGEGRRHDLFFYIMFESGGSTVINFSPGTISPRNGPDYSVNILANFTRSTIQ